MMIPGWVRNTVPYGVFLEFPGKVCGLVPRRVGITFLTHLSLASLLWDIGKQNSPRCDAAEHFKPVNDHVFIILMCGTLVFSHIDMVIKLFLLPFFLSRFKKSINQ